MRLLLSAILGLMATSIFCQNYVDLANVYYQNTSRNTFDTTNKSTNILEYGVSVTLPIVLSDKVAFLTGASVDKFTLNLTPTALRSTLSSYLLKAGLNIKHSEKVNGTYMLLPKLASDFEDNVNSKDFQLGALALLKFKKREGFKYKLGLYYNPDRFGTFFCALIRPLFQCRKMGNRHDLTG